MPDHFIPFASYSLAFVLTVLRAYFLGGKTVSAICHTFQIALATLYGWITLFKDQKAIWLGILEEHTHKPIQFIDQLFNGSFNLSEFYALTHLSFLQAYKTTRSDSS